MSDDDRERMWAAIETLRNCALDTKTRLVVLEERDTAAESERKRNLLLDAEMRVTYRIAKWVLAALGVALIGAAVAGAVALVEAVGRFVSS
jgi:hypothetical protein